MRLALAKWLLDGTDYHVHANPGKHPETRAKLNGAVSKRMEALEQSGRDEHEGRKLMDAQDQMREMYDEEEYYERKYGREKK